MGKSTIQKSKIVNYSSGKSLSVRLRGKRLSNNAISLYLDYYQGYSRDEQGSVKTRRKVEYLKIYLIDSPKTSKEREQNNESMKLAQEIRNRRESDLQHNSEGLISPYRKKTNFFDYCDAYINNYKKKDIRMMEMAVREFKSHTGQKYLTAKQIDPTLIKGFRDKLLDKYNGETPNSVFARLKKILRAATDEGLFLRNPGENITCRVPDGIPKGILLPDEIIKLASAVCPNKEVKRAFLLSLNTGLRFVDIEDLKYKHIINNNMIKKHQQKTGREILVDLNPTAIKLIGEMKNPDDKIFKLPSFTACLKNLKTWTAKAKIDKKITWHSARHSFATILLMNKTDIRTVGSLLGHSKLEHTQKYTHVINELKAQAVNVLPEISSYLNEDA